MFIAGVDADDAAKGLAGSPEFNITALGNGDGDPESLDRNKGRKKRDTERERERERKVRSGTMGWKKEGEHGFFGVLL